jgi:hypothetical protein
MHQIPLTNRDKAILNDCYKSTVLSFSQIHKRHFITQVKATVHNRLTELLRRGYVTKARVGSLAHPGGQRNVGVVYQISRTGIRALKKILPNDNFRPDPLRLSLYCLPHDLLLNEVVWALEKRFPQGNFRHGRLSGGRDAKRIPDTEFILGGERVALELELTAKSDRRYREIVLQYLLSPIFKKIVYVVASDRIKEKVSYQITQRRALPGLPTPSTGKFYFVGLQDLLKSPMLAPITNGEGRLEQEVQS